MNRGVLSPKSTSTSIDTTQQSMASGNPEIVKMPPVEDPERTIPHSAEYGNTYNIGTCYDEEKTSPWNIEEPKS